jgi:hypothetical protein
MKTKFLLTLLVIPCIFYISCTSAPKSDEAKTSEAKEVKENTTDQKWKLDTAASKIEWVGTKVTGYHTGNVPLKSGRNLREERRGNRRQVCYGPCQYASCRTKEC